ncbi:MAG: hypothetical protein GX146_09345 [Myxococcales bacterium]|nr:hypothetical protein [Myxococcales bacterium]
MTRHIESFMKPGADFLGSRYPIICGAMSWVSDAKLVAAMGDAGGFGLLAGANAPPEVFRDEILKTRELTQAPFGVNLITVSPNYASQLDMVCEMDCSTIVFAGSFPKEKEIKRAKESGAKVICFAPTEALAHKLIAMGSDALILEGSEAGGHIGPVALTVLLQQILFRVDTVPIFTAGGIATGEMIAHMFMMGAAGVQLGTRFVMSRECTAHYKFKEEFRKARARDAVATPQFDHRLPVIPVRALKNAGTAEFSKLQLSLMSRLERNEISREDAQYEVEHYWLGALRRAVVDGDVDHGSLMAGQSVGLMDDIKSLKEIIEEFLTDAEATILKLKQRICTP